MEKDQSQLDKFKAAARDLECDDDPVRFDAMVKKIAVAPKGDSATGKGRPPSKHQS